ncbi:MAG: hypothetical protein IJR90_04170 [Clostridia bacterium]|nr:hypothetical protein [Clostridia bacterium]
MKKAFIFLLAAAVAAALFSSCAQTRRDPPPETAEETGETSAPMPETETELPAPETEPEETADTLSAGTEDTAPATEPPPKEPVRPGYAEFKGSTIDKLLGCTEDVESFLTAHLDEYLGTPYQGLFRNIDQPWVLLQYKGGGFADPHMNCAGFLSSVFQRCGGDIGRIPSQSGAYANAYNWKVAAERAGLQRYRFPTIADALKSGVLRKGDLIYIHPVSFETGDCHIGFFWGDSPDDDKFLNALLRNDYTRSLGYNKSGVMITPIIPESEYVYLLVIPVSHG